MDCSLKKQNIVDPVRKIKIKIEKENGREIKVSTS
jgi:hypothetical protein